MFFLCLWCPGMLLFDPSPCLYRKNQPNLSNSWVFLRKVQVLDAWKHFQPFSTASPFCLNKPDSRRNQLYIQMHQSEWRPGLWVHTGPASSRNWAANLEQQAICERGHMDSWVLEKLSHVWKLLKERKTKSTTPYYSKHLKWFWSWFWGLFLGSEHRYLEIFGALGLHDITSPHDGFPVVGGEHIKTFSKLRTFGW